MFSFEITAHDRKNQYPLILKQLQHLIEEETDWLANLSNSAAHLFHTLGQVNWVGFYLRKQDQLVLGPFQGKPACVRIPVGKGVCGTAVAENKTILVPNVHQFPGHIACDAETKSEIVIPLRFQGEIIGVLDIDSPELERFNEEDQTYLEQYVEYLVSHTGLISPN
ncbi:GAF domain-containing protein [Thermoactinomyces sp. DSM 45891]|uniref:GAF domain-containing protein n=1 Tax=Thermoactinomyces sp. DSM 45891 TaxID=1761907 RepID=UPI000919D834|nr:GAF domain-containing protein [Thermoactinomyces sp. DSM 45891]SFX44852.1 GAF domain-containing protein [Thermoactinomyces sp. DSM 45891]